MEAYALNGSSLFETFLARKGSFWRLQEHHRRLITSAAFFHMTAPDWPTFRRQVSGAHDGSRDEVMRYTLLQKGGRWSQTPSGMDHAVFTRPYQGASPTPLALCFAEHRLAPSDPLRCHKSGARVYYQSQFQHARLLGYHDCVFVDQNGDLLETSSHNLYLYIDGAWLTPPTNQGLLPGITRGVLLADGRVRDEPISVNRLQHAKAMVVSNSVQGLVPVARLGDHLFEEALALQLISSAGNRCYQRLF